MSVNKDYAEEHAKLISVAKAFGINVEKEREMFNRVVKVPCQTDSYFAVWLARAMLG